MHTTLRELIRHIVLAERDDIDDDRVSEGDPEDEVLGMLAPDLEVDEAARSQGGYLVVVPSDRNWSAFHPKSSDLGKAHAIAHAVEEIMVTELGYVDDPLSASSSATLKLYRPDDGARFTIGTRPSTIGARARGAGNVGIDLIYTGRSRPPTQGKRV